MKSDKKKVKFKNVRASLSEMGTLAAQSMDLAIRSLADRTDEHEKALSAIETELDDHESELEKNVLGYLDSKKPKGKKLRFCTVSMKIASDYERIGDRAFEMIKRLVRMNGFQRTSIPASLLDMSKMVGQMTQYAIEAIDNRDLALSKKVSFQYQQINELANRVNSDLHDAAEKGDPSAIQLTLIARHLDRIGGVARSIAQNVEFIVLGDISESDD